MVALLLENLPAASSAAVDDLLYLVTDPAGTPTDKKISVADLLASAASLTDLATQTFAGPLILSDFTSLAGFIAFGQPAHRIPTAINVTIDGTTLLNAADLVNKVAFAFDVNLIGGFSSEAAKGAPDPGFAFMTNGYWLSGTLAGAIAGLTDWWGALLETHNRTPGSVLNNQKTFVAQSYVDDATAHTNNITTAELFGAAGVGTADTAITLIVHAPTIGTTRFGASIEGAVALYGNVDLFNSTKFDAHNGTIATQNLNVGDNGVTGGLGAHMNMRPSNGSGAIAMLAGTAPTVDLLRIMENGGSPRFRVDPNLYMIIGKNGAPSAGALGNNEMTIWLDPTIGATKVMFFAKDSGGTVRAGSLALA